MEESNKKSSWLGNIIGLAIFIIVIMMLFDTFLELPQVNISSSQDLPPPVTYPALGTKYERSSFQELSALATTPTYDDLFRNNERYVGAIVRYGGEIIQVIPVSGDKYNLRANIAKTVDVLPATGDEYNLRANIIMKSRDTIFLEYSGPRLLEGDIVRFVGEVAGLQSYTAVLGQEITIPKIKVYGLELVVKAGKDN